MSKDKAPKMPRVPDEDGVERHSAYTRMNPMGHKEFVQDDDEETLNELSEDLMECAEQFIWQYVHDNLPQSILERPDTDDKIDAAIGRGEGPDTIIRMFKESVAFGGPLPTGGGAGSPEQLQSDRQHNRLVGSSGDQEREAGEDVNNFTATTPQAADGPEQSRAKSKIGTRTIRGVGPRNKSIVGHNGDGLDYGATHSESFTGTGAIAISPGGGYNFVDDGDDDDEEDDDQGPEKQTESDMTARRKDVLTEQVNQLLAEWEPSFKGGGEYSPGDYQMPSPTGDGVADRKPKKDKVGKYDTDTSQNGKEWPRDHKDTEAMSSVGDDGTDDGSGGYHDSSHAEASDGYQTAVGHNWPDEAKNDGSGVAEPFEGDRWSDGGTLKGTAPDEIDNAGTAQKMPSTGPITGTSGPQLGQPSEGRWSPTGMASLMEGEVNLQSLFDSYARDYEMVCVEDFQALCNAHGAGATIDETSMLQLMEANQQFIFYHGEDANGPYWTPTAIAEEAFPGAAPPFGSEDSDDEDDDGDDGDDDDCAMESKKPWEDDEDDDGDDDAGEDCVEEGSWGGFQTPDDPDNDDPNRTPRKRKPLRARPPGRSHRDPKTGIVTTNPDDEDDSMSEGENRRPFGKRTVSELQIRPVDKEAGLYSGMGGRYGDTTAGGGPTDLDYAGDPDMGAGISPEGAPLSSGPGVGGPSAYDERLGASQGIEAQEGPGPFAGAGCPECGAPDMGEASCPECGMEMGMGPEEEGFGAEIDPELATSDEYMDWDDRGSYGDEEEEMAMGPNPQEYPVAPGPPGPPPMEPGMESRMVNSPAIMENLHNFMQSARRILENNQEFSPQYIGEALRYSWSFHARKVNPQTTPRKVRTTLEGLAKRFPVFATVMESGSDAMESADGSAIGTGGATNNSGNLPTTDTEMKDEGEPLGASQENDLEGTPEIKGTAKGMDGKGSVAQAVKENVARLSNHVQKAIREGAQSLRGKYNVQFSLVVAEGKKKNRTPIRTRLAEALADAEEVLQLHKAKDVELEATFKDAKGAVTLQHSVPLFTIKPRGLLTTEGKALFRFQRNAENFANELVSEGYTCRVVGHNWGRAVIAKTPIAIAESVFRGLRK